MGTYTDLSVQSIFSEASAQNARDPHTFHIISNAGATSKLAEYGTYGNTINLVLSHTRSSLDNVFFRLSGASCSSVVAFVAARRSIVRPRV